MKTAIKRIFVSANDLIENGLWDDVCSLLGLNPWCVNEGLMSGDEEIELTAEQAQGLGIL